MRRTVTASLALAFAVTATAQEDFVPAKPGPEHKPLEKMVGEWDATVTMEDGTPPLKGSMVYKMDLGGLWLVGRFKGEFAGMPFEGMDITGYCPIKKKYVSTWMDSMSKTPAIGEGTYDAGSGKLVILGTSPGPDGESMMKTKSVSTWVNDDQMKAVMYMVTPEGEEVQMMTIDYKRKK